MHLEERLLAFFHLGKKIESIDSLILAYLGAKARNENPWFTEENIKNALTGVRKLLEKDALLHWISPYNIQEAITPSVIGMILAGNIPCVGFHDILCVLISGNKALIKLSSKDAVLTTFILDQLIQEEPRFKDYILLTDRVKDFDAVIATGSDNSSRYFEYYFSKYPSIIRKNRTSIAILSGEETEEDLEQLGFDVFSYFGLGCRNISKLFVPQNYPFPTLLEKWKMFEYVIHHHKYANNYDYQKAIMMVNKTAFYDNGFALVTQSKNFVSPISVLYYDTYNSEEDLEGKLNQNSNKIQCVVGKKFPASIPFGQAQFPGPGDYADQVDTMKFLVELTKA